MVTRKLVCAFPGQGIQAIGMADQIKNTTAWHLFEKAKSILGYDLGELCLNGPKEKLNQTNYAQPAIYVTSYAFWELVRQQYKPNYFLGHSLGEITALTAAGAFSFEDGVKLVQVRGSLMGRADFNGGMSAILGLDLDSIHQLVREVTTGFVQVSNENSTGQTVISGDEEGLKRIATLAKERGAKRVVRLNVSGPFHSKLMEPVAQEFAKIVEDLKIKQVHTPVLSNDGKTLLEKPEEIKKALIDQLIKPVRFTASVEKLVDLGVEQFVEISPTQLLIPLARRINSSLEFTLVKDGGI